MDGWMDDTSKLKEGEVNGWMDGWMILVNRERER